MTKDYEQWAISNEQCASNGGIFVRFFSFRLCFVLAWIKIDRMFKLCADIDRFIFLNSIFFFVDFFNLSKINFPLKLRFKLNSLFDKILSIVHWFFFVLFFLIFVFFSIFVVFLVYSNLIVGKERENKSLFVSRFDFPVHLAQVVLKRLRHSVRTLNMFISIAISLSMIAWTVQTL